MKLIITTFLLFFVSTSFAANPFSKYVGCYDATSVDGVSVYSDGVSLSSIELGKSNTFIDKTSKDYLSSVNLTVGYQAEAMGLWTVNSADAFDIGNFNSDNNGDHYSYSGLINYKETSSYGEETVSQDTIHSQIDISKKPNGALVIKILKAFNKNSNWNLNHTYVLVPDNLVKCSAN